MFLISMFIQPQLIQFQPFAGIKVSRIDYIEIETFQIEVLTNVLLPGDISMEDFALALAGKGGWLQCFKQL